MSASTLCKTQLVLGGCYVGNGCLLTNEVVE